MAGEWPIDRLDVAALAARGWRPHPFRQFVLKIHSRCDLACDYCYVYAMGDHTWRSRPAVITAEAISAAAHRIAEHCRIHQLPDVTVILHGGEPLLAGHSVIRSIAAALRSAVPHTTQLTLYVQTNGMLLTENMLDLLLELDIQVGVSLDGGAGQHDRHRRTVGGKGSYQRIAGALRLLNSGRYRRLYRGLLCVIDLDADPLDTYRSLLDFQPPKLDFLLPHGNWTVPPPHRSPGDHRTPYGDWLVAVFDHWYGAPHRETGVRIFEEIMHLAFGGSSQSELIGLSPVALLVIDTDGAIEQVDTLRSVHHGAAATGMNVFGNDFDEVLTHPAIAARQIGTEALSKICRDCRIHRICGAGHYPHRYRRGSGFRNPSVYCPDLTRLIEHIVGRLQADIADLLGT